MIFQDISNHKQCESVKKEINRDLAMIKKKNQEQTNNQNRPNSTFQQVEKCFQYYMWLAFYALSCPLNYFVFHLQGIQLR